MAPLNSFTPFLQSRLRAESQHFCWLVRVSYKLVVGFMLISNLDSTTVIGCGGEVEVGLLFLVVTISDKR